MKYLKLVSTTLVILIAVFSSVAISGNTANAALTDGLVGHWTFDEGSGTTAGDASGNSNTGTLVNGPTWVTGSGAKVGNGAISFDGSNDCVDAGNPASLNIQSAVSISAWVNFRTSGINRSIVAKGSVGGADSTQQFKLFEYGGNRAAFSVNNGSLSLISMVPSDSIAGNTWVHVVGTYNGTDTTKLYINGALIDSDTVASFGTLNSSGRNLNIGNSQGSIACNSAVFDGYLDDVRIYSRALLPADVTELYSLGGGNVTLPPGTPGTPENPPVTGSDTTAPTVSVTSPSVGQTVSGTITLTASASDPTVSGQTTSGVAGVQFLVDGSNAGSEDTSSPYSYPLNTSNLSNGSHTISARARDSAGNLSALSSVSVTVSNTAPVVTGAQIYTVKTDGTGSYTSIQACVNVAKAGDTCEVYSGTYNEEVVFKSTVDGTANARITVKAAAGQTVEMYGFDTGGADYVTISGFNISTNDAITTIPASVGVLVRSSNVRITGNYFYNIKEVAITPYTVGSTVYSDIYIADNRIYHSQIGIVVNGTNWTVENNEIERLFNYVGGDTDFSRFFGENIIFRNNHFFGNRTGEMSGHVDGFQFFDTNGYNARNILIENNRVEGIFGQGIMAHGRQYNNSGDFVIRNNVFAGTATIEASLIQIVSVKNVSVYNNTFVNAVYFGLALIDGSTGDIRNNIFYNDKNTQTLLTFEAGMSTASNNLHFSTSRTLDPTKYPGDIVNMNPQFRNSASFDFHLNSGSPAIDAGLVLSGFSKDLEGKNRPGGSAWDIGAYEYDGGQAVTLPSGDCARANIRCVDDTPGANQEYATIQACANAMVPGDTCLVISGNYPEHVETKLGLAASAAMPITFKAVGAATMKGFRLRHPYITIEGFDMTKYATGLDAGYVALEPEADYCTIKNNTFRDGVQLSATDYYFDSATRTIRRPSGGFLAAGFEPGALIYIGSNINNLIKNHDKVKKIKSVTDTVITLEDTETLITEGPVFSLIYVTRFVRSGVAGIGGVLSSSRGAADHCTITGNTFYNLAGNPFYHLSGSYHLVERNTIEKANGWGIFNTIVGHDNVFRYNHIKNSPRYDGFELPTGTIDQSTGEYWDFVDQFLTMFGNPNVEVSNNLFEYNFIEKIDNEFMNVNESYPGYTGTLKPASGLTFRNNVIIDIEMSGGTHLPNTVLENNTFLRAASNDTAPHTYVASNSEYGRADGLVIRNNAFVENNGRVFTSSSPNNRGWYSIVSNPTYGNVQMTPPNHNYVAGAVSLGYPAKTGFAGKETNGINGGDPKFQNVNNPVGPDGIPFTSDDGLIPLAGSPLCTGGQGGTHIGAYPCAGSAVVTPPSTPTPDTTLPTVSITSPASGSTISASVTLSATASDPTVTGQTTSGIAGVQFKLDGVNLGTELTIAPYSGTWNTQGVSNGSHTLTAVARDAAGNTRTSNSVTVTVSNTVAQTTTPPAGGSTTGGNTTASGGTNTTSGGETTPGSNTTTGGNTAGLPPTGTFTPTVPQLPLQGAGGNCYSTTTRASSYTFTGAISPGMYHRDIKELQKFLNASGFKVANTGPGSPGQESTYYGSLTKAAVTRFQIANNITTDPSAFGLIGPRTRAKLNELSSKPITSTICPTGTSTPAITPATAPSQLSAWLTLGNTHREVLTIQKLLNAKGYTVSLQGSGSPGNETTYFGPATQNALRRFQCAKLNVCSGTPSTTGYGATGPRTRAELSK